MCEFRVGEKSFGFLNPFFIAEIGVNHEGSFARARKMIIQASEAGASAVKFQTYTAKRLASPVYAPGYWDARKEPTKSQFELFDKFRKLTPQEYEKLADLARELGVEFMSTAFDEDSLSTIDPLVKIHKIASADVTNVPLLRAIGVTKKPVIISAGASNVTEVLSAVTELKTAGTAQIAVLHCVLNYPTSPEHANLSAIKFWQDKLPRDISVGYSDHVAPADGRALSVEQASMLGAVVVEKHFSDRAGSAGNDHYHSMNHKQLAQSIKNIRLLGLMYGRGEPELESQSVARTNARRRVFAKTDLLEGEEITAEKVEPLRANTGIEISAWDDVIGRKTSRPLKSGDPVTWESLSATASQPF